MGAIIDFPGRPAPSIKAFPTRRPRRRRRRFDRSAAAILGLLLAAICFFVFSLAGEAADAPRLHVRVVDGDTIENTVTGERIRLPNIDTPETGERAHCAAEREAGERAKSAARTLIGGGDITIAPTGRIDSYGRSIGYVRVNGRDLGEALMAQGLARPWRGRREPWCGAGGVLLPAS